MRYYCYIQVHWIQSRMKLESSWRKKLDNGTQRGMVFWSHSRVVSKSWTEVEVVLSIQVLMCTWPSDILECMPSHRLVPNFLAKFKQSLPLAWTQSLSCAPLKVSLLPLSTKLTLKDLRSREKKSLLLSAKFPLTTIATSQTMAKRAKMIASSTMKMATNLNKLPAI